MTDLFILDQLIFWALKFTYWILDDGRFFSAAAMEFGGTDIRIMNAEFQNFEPYRMLFTKQNDPYWLDGEYKGLFVRAGIARLPGCLDFYWISPHI